MIHLQLLRALRRRPRLLVCVLLAAGLFALTAAGCASKPKPPSTVKEFLSQPRPK